MSPKRGQAAAAGADHGPVTGAGSGLSPAGANQADGGGRTYGGEGEDAQIMQILANIPKHGSQPPERSGSQEHADYRPSINVPVSDSPRGGATARSPRSNANVFLARSPPPGGEGSISTGYQSPGTLALAASSASAWPGVSAASVAATTTPRRGGSAARGTPGGGTPNHDSSQRSPDGGDDDMDVDVDVYSGDEVDDSPMPKGKPKGGARKGQPKPRLDKSTDAWKQTRKDNHKEVERRRRETINDGILELKKIVPGTEKNKGEILRQAVKYIQHLKEAEATNIEKWTLEKLLTDQQLHEQENRVKALELEVAELRAYVGRLGGDGAEVRPAPALAPITGGGGGGDAANGVPIEPSLSGKRGRGDEVSAEVGKRVRIS